MRVGMMAAVGVGTILAAACSPAEEAASTAPIAPGPDAYTALQTALIEAQPGDVIELAAGTFAFTDGLSLDVDDVSIRGAGEGETILSYAAQEGAGEGLLITSDNVTVSDLTMQDTKGDGIKSKGSNGITFRDLTVEWTGGPDPENGAYGVYPVESQNVLVDNVTVRGASDAGIYVGQSNNIIVRNSLAEFNVAGIEIENSSNADVYDNVATNNAGGILVFDLPNLPVMGGHSTRVFNNRIVRNNTPNFAPPGNIVANVPAGSGLMMMANQNVHVFENEFDDNQSAHILIYSYSYEFEDDRYNPLPRDFVIRDNSYGDGGYDPKQRLEELSQLTGGTLPDIVWDGITAYPGGSEDVRIVVDEPEDVTYVSLGLSTTPVNPMLAQVTNERQPVVEISEPDPVVLPQDASS